MFMPSPYKLTLPLRSRFPLKDPVSFTESAAVFESVGVSAYVNIVSQLEDKSHVNMAGAMLSFEGRAQAWSTLQCGYRFAYGN